jgi:hypothetical protein
MFVVEGSLIYLDKAVNGGFAAYEDGLRSCGVYANVRGPEAYTYHAAFLAKSPDNYQATTRAALEAFADTKVAVYAQARRDVDLLRREIPLTFSQVDVRVTPTMVAEPVLIADSARDNLVDWRNTVPFNTFGLPAIWREPRGIAGRPSDCGATFWGIASLGPCACVRAAHRIAAAPKSRLTMPSTALANSGWSRRRVGFPCAAAHPKRYPTIEGRC